MVNTEIRLIIFFAAKDGESLYTRQKKRPGVDCGSDHELLIAKFRLKLKKALPAPGGTHGACGAAPLLHRAWGSLGVVLPPRRCNGPPAWSCIALGSRSYPPVVPAATHLKAALRGGGRRPPAGTPGLSSSDSLLSGSEGLPSALPLLTGASRGCLFLDLVHQSSWRTSIGLVYLSFLPSVYLLTYFWAAPGLCCCVEAVPGCMEWGLLSSGGGWASHRGARGAAWPLGTWAFPGSGTQRCLRTGSRILTHWAPGSPAWL